MPLVILEGPDGSGKSSLAGRLLKGTGYPTLLVKRSGPPGDNETLEFQARWIKEQAESGLNIMADRHPLISEAIYKPTVRKEGNAPWNVFDVRDVLERYDFKHLLLIYCRPDFERMKKSSRVEQQMPGVLSNFRALVEEYDRWMQILQDGHVPIVTYDFDADPTASIMVQRVKRFWESTK